MAPLWFSRRRFSSVFSETEINSWQGVWWRIYQKETERIIKAERRHVTFFIFPFWPLERIRLFYCDLKVLYIWEMASVLLLHQQTGWHQGTRPSHTRLTGRLIDRLFRWPFDLPAGCMAVSAVSRREAVIKWRFPPAGLIKLCALLIFSSHLTVSLLWLCLSWTDLTV